MDEFRRPRRLDPAGAKDCVAVVRTLAADPRPPQARALGESGGGCRPATGASCTGRAEMGRGAGRRG